MLKWEQVEGKLDSGDVVCKLYRAKVPGGWLVVTRSGDQGSELMNTVFYPDKSHAWTGDPEEDEKSQQGVIGMM